MKDTTIRRTAALFAAAALTAPGAAWATDEQGKGEERSASAPGQVKPAGEPAAPPQARAKGSEGSQAGARTRGRSESAPRGNANGHDEQAAEGMSKGETKAAQPRGSKPATTPAPAASKPKAGRGMAHQKTTLCHATGSETNPYVTITISNAAVKAHDRHQHDEDIIPAPAGGCPGAAASQDAPAGEQTVTPTGTEETPSAPAAQGTLPGTGDVLGETESGTGPAAHAETPAADGRSGVLGEFAERESGAAPATPAAGAAGETDEATTDREAGADTAAAQLPLTGLELWVVLVAGLALLLAGITAKRAAATRA